MNADELVVGRRYRLGSGPEDAREFRETGSYLGVIVTCCGRQRTFRLDNDSFYFTTNPERDVRPMEEA